MLRRQRSDPVTGDELERHLLELRRRGMPYSSLVLVAEYFFGWRLDADQIRRRLRRLGVQPDATRARYGQQNALVCRRGTSRG